MPKTSRALKVLSVRYRRVLERLRGHPPRRPSAVPGNRWGTGIEALEPRLLLSGASGNPSTWPLAALLTDLPGAVSAPIVASMAQASGPPAASGVNATSAASPLISASYTLNELAGFQGANGQYPFAGLVMDSAGDLYGTTYDGGANGDGSVFELPAGGSTVTTLVSFNGTNGSNPWAGLSIDAAGNLYGTTVYGGAGNDGEVFEVAAHSNTVTALASFNGTNGQSPRGSLVRDSSGDLFGTTEYGGANDDGTVFELPAASGSGTISTLASFNGTNGANPWSGLARDGAGDLYGTTMLGGTDAQGAVFEVAAGSNAVTTLASFTGTNGSDPFGGSLAIDAGGDLYGTTETGGSDADGTVFEVAAGSGAITALASFNGTDGANPEAGVSIDASGDLYGTTWGGGADADGTIFVVAAGSGAITTLASFNGTDGANARGGLIADSNGDFYGTAAQGGVDNDGTVFELTASSSYPSAGVSGNGNPITNGSNSPSTTNDTNFGSVIQGAATVDETYTITNSGTATLTVGAVGVPSGFTLVTAPAATVAAGSNTTFTVGLLTTSAGTPSGNISFTTNDLDNPDYTFGVTGTVTSAPFPASSNPTVNQGSQSISLPAGATTYLYAQVDGGGATTGALANGSTKTLDDAAGFLAAGLGVSTAATNSFATSAAYSAISAVGVSGYSGMTVDYGTFVNAGSGMVSSGSFNASVTFTLTQPALVVALGLGSSQETIAFSGVTGLVTDAAPSGSEVLAGIAHADLGAGTYTLTETTTVTTSQNQQHMADLLGVYIFTGTNTAAGPATSNPAVTPGSKAIALPTGATTYLYAQVAGGGATTGALANGSTKTLVDAAGYLAGGLGVSTSATNSFSTSAAYYGISGVGVSGYSSMTADYGTWVNTGTGTIGSGSFQASVTFTLTQSALVVALGLGSSQQTIAFSGVAGLVTDTAPPGSEVLAGIAQADLGAGTYTLTETTSVTAAAQAQPHMADLLGVYIFTGTSPSFVTFGALAPPAGGGTAGADIAPSPTAVPATAGSTLGDQEGSPAPQLPASPFGQTAADTMPWNRHPALARLSRYARLVLRNIELEA